MSVSKIAVKKIGHRACLADKMGQTYPILMRVLAQIMRVNHRFTLHFAVAGSKGL